MKVWVTGYLTLASHSKLICEGVSGAGKEHDPLMSRQAAVRQASRCAFRSEQSREHGGKGVGALGGSPPRGPQLEGNPSKGESAHVLTQR